MITKPHQLERGLLPLRDVFSPRPVKLSEFGMSGRFPELSPVKIPAGAVGFYANRFVIVGSRLIHLSQKMVGLCSEVEDPAPFVFRERFAHPFRTKNLRYPADDVSETGGVRAGNGIVDYVLKMDHARMIRSRIQSIASGRVSKSPIGVLTPFRSRQARPVRCQKVEVIFASF